MSLMTGEKTGGGVATVKVDEQGRLLTSTETTGPDGAELATEETLDKIADATFEGDEPLDVPRKLAVHVGNVVQTQDAAQFASATAAAAAGSLGGVYVAGIAGTTLVDDPAVRGAVTQLEGEVADDATTADVQAVEAELQNKATEATAAAIETAVDDLEADADATRIAAEATNAKTPPLVSGRVPVDGSGVTQPVSVVEKATFHAVVSALPTTTQNASMISLALAAGSPVTKVTLLAIYIRNVQSANITGVVNTFELFRFTTHAGGTVIAPHAHDTTDVLSGDVTVRSGATISGEASGSVRRWLFSSDEWQAGAVEAESTQVSFANHFPVFSRIDPTERLLTIRPGQGVHIKLTAPASPNGTFDFEFVFTQE